jgi:signal transduction histidine kinase
MTSRPAHRSPAALLREENRALRERLAALEREWQETLDTIPDAVALCDGEGRVLRANRALRDATGHPDLAPARPPSAPQEPCGIDAALAPLRLKGRLQEALAGEVLTWDESLPGGRHYTVTLSPIARGEAPTGASPAAVLLLHDATAERRMQRRLLLGERMAAVGQLAAGLAHEINNPVSFAIANLQMARELLARHPGLFPDQAPPFSDMAEMLDECMVGMGRVRDIIRDLRTFTGTELRTTSSEVCLDDLLDLAMRLTRSEVQRRARLVYERDLLPTPPVRGDAGKLSHVLLNLLAHALHNLPPPDEAGGAAHCITVRTRTDRRRGMVELLVADTGPPLPEEVRAHLFEPFAQRRVRLPPELSAAIGMGLAVSYEIVRRHGGEIEARPAAGAGPGGGGGGQPAGNELLVRLPLAAACAEASDGLVRRRVLFVDDEPPLLRAYQRLVGDLHDVTAVSSGREALDLLRGGETFDAIFCDLVMPGLDGLRLYRTVAEADPASAGRFVFLVSGAFSPEVAAFLSQVDRPHVDKPPGREALLRAIDLVA